jgi:NAD-dependent DNA ligase
MTEGFVELDSAKCPNCGYSLEGEDDSTFLYCPNKDCPVVRITILDTHDNPITLKE